MDRKAALRARTAGKPRLPKLREEKKADSAPGPSDGKERLQKILASAGVCSRRKAEELILLGQVTVNGAVVNTLGAKADPRNDTIAVDGKVVDLEGQERLYFLLNKPRGYITTTNDPQGRPTVMELLKGVEERVYPVGRLDYASEGLILLTNDGEMANRLMHPSSGVRRLYAVKVKGRATDEQIRLLRKGMQLSDGFVKPLRVRRDEKLENKEWVQIEVTEGKNLEIRRMLAVVGLEVDRLRRIGIGPLNINQVAVGKFVSLTRRQVEEVLTSAALSKSEDLS